MLRVGEMRRLGKALFIIMSLIAAYAKLCSAEVKVGEGDGPISYAEDLQYAPWPGEGTRDEAESNLAQLVVTFTQDFRRFLQQTRRVVFRRPLGTNNAQYQEQLNELQETLDRLLKRMDSIIDRLRARRMNLLARGMERLRVFATTLRYQIFNTLQHNQQQSSGHGSAAPTHTNFRNQIDEIATFVNRLSTTAQLFQRQALRQ